ncbi:uncharacterized protein LOC113170210 isoform X2 [Anabas testudineus]|uniref:uncharacterized protein LOC113170210 isoform X2 n=1 Tax=Anabas testudineus TaxID=64144 RepID=UPI000E45703E|nr:uncharacterized protein LOC113170210 isoform X2 [Anabas testudineus]
MAHTYSQGLLFLVLVKVVSECKVDSLVIDPVTAFKDEDKVIPCFNSTVMDPNSFYRVRLIKFDAAPTQNVVFAWPNKKQDTKRVKWERRGNESMKLYIKDVKKSDEGLYGCEVCQGWECTLVKNISLKVKDCKIGSPEKAAPSTPFQLNCAVEKTSEQQGPQNVSWVQLKGGNPVSLNFEWIEIKGTSLVIRSVNANTIGWYRCQYMLGQTQSCLDINLSIQENVKTTAGPTALAATTQQAPTTSDAVLGNIKGESRRTLIAVVVASVVLGIVITAALMGLFIYCRRRTLRVSQPNQGRPAGALRYSIGAYEIVNPTDESSVQQINSLYQQYEESLCTFQR